MVGTKTWEVVERVMENNGQVRKADQTPVPWWPGTTRDNEFWEQAKRELGSEATVSQIALRAQDIKVRAKLAEDEIERERRG